MAGALQPTQKCPECGSTEIRFQPDLASLRDKAACQSCLSVFEWDPVMKGPVERIPRPMLERKVTLRIPETFTEYSELKARILPGQTALFKHGDGATDMVYRHSDGFLYHSPMNRGEFVG